jgi:outer membrane murein-binding lipoprotein Lpp
MSLFNRMFGSGGNSRGGGGTTSSADAQQQLSSAIQQINEQISAFEKKIEQIEKRIQAETIAAKRVVAAHKGDKTKARPHLLRRARLQKQLTQIHGIIDNMEAQKFTMETASLNKGAVDSITAGQRAIRAQGIDADRLAEQLEDVQEDVGGHTHTQRERGGHTR